MVKMPQVKRFPGRVIWRPIPSGFGVGYIPTFPGTLGSLLALPLWYWGGGKGAVHFGALAALLILALPATMVEIRATGQKDPPTGVIDQGAGKRRPAAGRPWG